MSGKINDGGPAFPVHGGYPEDDPRNQIIGGGMTLRDAFAISQIYLGRFDTPEEAYAAYCKAAKERHKEFANFG